MLIDFTPSEKSFREVQEKFCRIFTSRWEWIYAESITEKGKAAWKTINSKTWKFAKERELPRELTDEKLWSLWKSDQEVVGVGFGKTTKYLMLDIDAESPYHPDQGMELRNIRWALEDIGLISSVVVRSSYSGGLHLYYPLPEAVGSYDLASKVTEYLTAAGYEVANGKLEIFPNKKALGKKDDPKTWTQYQRHRLPLQQGSVILDEDYEPDSCGLSMFIQQWELCASSQSHGELLEAIYGKTQYQHHQGVSAGLKPIQAEYEELLKRGFTTPHQTNDILIQLGRQTRILEGLGGVALRDRLIEIVTGLPNYEKYCQHQIDIHQRCQDIARWAERRHKPAGSQTKESAPLPPPGKNNQEKKQDAIERIKRALNDIENIREAFVTKTSFLKAIAKQAKSSMSTLVKYWEKLLQPIFSKHHSQQIEVQETNDEIVCNSASGKVFSHLKDKNHKTENACNPLSSKDFSTIQEKTYTKEIARSARPLAVVSVEAKRQLERKEIEKYIKRSKELELTKQQRKKKSVQSVITQLKALEQNIRAAYGNNRERFFEQNISEAYKWEKRKIPRWLSEFGLHQKYWYLYGTEPPEDNLLMQWVLINRPPHKTPPEKLILVEVDIPIPT
ncbi:hypothetical protein [Picosynechococcus sp. NKBG15041c]|uniref:hypothetical protein n=1 Tax=Picosynechococcus sp. NKBG15041c TaxID=1407650 RepID=UPI00042A69AE|nr:hypothetical protein [Picosynechococcus sp. NKBG15041c]